ncbi:MAG TPA: hypothetical protein VGP72_03840 [Planctomycetota bacterium]|jgi:hypothetical protein
MGFFDIIAIGRRGVLVVRVTRRAQMQATAKALQHDKALAAWLRAGADFRICGWSRSGTTWRPHWLQARCDKCGVR